jgi:hypothetical protein
MHRIVEYSKIAAALLDTATMIELRPRIGFSGDIDHVDPPVAKHFQTFGVIARLAAVPSRP